MFALSLALVLQTTAPATPLPAPAAAALAPPNGAYVYLSSLHGQSIGKTTITVTRSASPNAAIALNESSGGSLNGQSASGNATLQLDSTLIPTSYTAAYSFGGPAIHAALAFNGGQVNETSDRGSKSFTLATGTSRFTVLDGALFAGYFIVPAQMKSWKDAPATVVAPMYGQSTTLTALPPPALLHRPATVPAADAAFFGGVVAPGAGQIAFVEWYDPATMLVDEFDVPSQQLTVIRQR